MTGGGLSKGPLLSVVGAAGQRVVTFKEQTRRKQKTFFLNMADQLKGAASGIQNTVSSGAGKVSSTVQNPTSTASDGESQWMSLTEDQKKQAFESIPAEKKQNLSYMEWIKQGYHHQKENWTPWIEDLYLKWFTVRKSREITPVPILSLFPWWLETLLEMVVNSGLSHL